MKKKLNVEAITNELSGQSLSFNSSPPQKKNTLKGELDVSQRKKEEKKARTLRSTRTVYNQVKDKRKRSSFELYSSQIDKILIAAQKIGVSKNKVVSKSEVVRLALDAYFKKLKI